MESAEAHCLLGGDWSPRISFSYGFAAKLHTSSPAHSPAHDPEFEFSSFDGADLTPTLHMLSADELFCDGKLRVVEESSEFGVAGKGDGEKGIMVFSACRGNVGARRGGAEMEKGEGKSPAVRAGYGRGGARAEAATKERPTNRGDVLCLSSKQEKERPPTSRGDAAPLPPQKLEPPRNASLRREFAGGNGEALLEKRRCQAFGEDAASVQKSAMGCRGGSREDALLGIPSMEAGLRRQQQGLMAVKPEELRTPVKWREAASPKTEHSSAQWRRFSRNPRSSSMAFGDSAHRNCVSLENSRCPSPSRSFSLPATTPPSPTASASSSAFSASSSSRHTSRFREFFRLRKPAPGDADSRRIPLGARLFFPFFKAKEARSAITDAAPAFASKQPLEQHHSGAMKEQRIATIARSQASTLDHHSILIARHPSSQAAAAKPTPSPASRAEATASAADKAARSSVEPGIGSRSRKIRQSYSMDREALQAAGDIVWIAAGSSSGGGAGNGDSTPSEAFAKEGSRHGGRGSTAESAAGASARLHSKSSERPIPYTASVRVTPVLNVPSCITPSLRKAKPPSNLKSFSLERFLLGRGKTLEGPPKPPATSEGIHHH